MNMSRQVVYVSADCGGTGIEVMDPEGRLIRVSEQWLAFLGYAEGEVLGRRTGEFMTPASAARWEAAVAELTATGDE